MSREQIVADYLAGDVVDVIAERHGVHRSTVYLYARQAGVAGQRQHSGVDVIEDAEWLVADGQNLTSACARLGMKPDALWKACQRRGRLDIYDRLSDREANGELRRAVRAALRERRAA